MAKKDKPNVTSDEEPKAPLPPDGGASSESDQDTPPGSDENASSESGGDTPPESGSAFYKHRYVNCYLTLNPKEVAEGKPSVNIHLVKAKEQPWGVFETTDKGVQALIEAYPWFGKSIFKIEAEEAAKLNQPKPGSELYHRGVASAISRKSRK